MRSVIFGGANSLDNYIARADDGVDWLMWNDEVTEIMEAIWKRIDTMLIGRKTWEVSQKMGGGPETPGITTYLCSRTISSKPDGVELCDDAVALLQDLKTREGNDILIMGGGELGRSLFEADLIDEIGVSVHPVLLGSGIPLYHQMSRQIDLQLTECRQLKNGCVVLTYRVKR